MPKELIARFVKHCPLCLSRRTTQPRSASGASALSASSSASYYSGYRRGSGEDEGDDFEKIERQHSHAVEEEEEGGYDVQSLPLHYSGDTMHHQQQPGLAHPQQLQGQFSLPQSITRPGYEASLAHGRDHHLHQQQRYHPNHNYISSQMQSPVRNISVEQEDGTQEEAVDFTQKGLEGEGGEGEVEAQIDLASAFAGDDRSSQGFRPLLYHQKSHSSYSQHPQHHHQLHQHLHHEPASPSAPIAVVHPNGHILHDRHPILNSARLFGLDQGVGARGTGGVATLSAFPMTPSPSFHHRPLSLSPLHLNTAAFRNRMMPHLHSGLTTSSLDSPVELESDQSGDEEDERSVEGRPEGERQSQSSGEEGAESGGEDDDMDADEN